MKKIFIVFALLLMVSCSPSPEAIEKAIAQTQAAMPTNTVIPTSTPIILPTPTNTPNPTATLKPTITPIPDPNYILETGFCIMSVNPGDSDPKTVSGCGEQEREQVYLDSSTYVTVTFTKMVNQVQWYCAIYTFDGVFVASAIDRTASGKVDCRLP